IKESSSNLLPKLGHHSHLPAHAITRCFHFHEQTHPYFPTSTKMKIISLLSSLVLPCCCLAWSSPIRHAVISPPIMTTITTPLITSSSRSTALHNTPHDGYDACKTDDVVDLEIDAYSSSSEEDDGDDTSQNNISQQILSLATPALVSLAIDPLMTIADTAFVGRYSAPNDPYPLAGLGSAAALLVFSFYVFNFLATATAPLVAKARASKDEAGAKLVGGQALTLALILGTALTLTLLIFREPLLHVMGTGVTGVEADHYGEQFLTVRALAAPAVLICSASNGILRGYLDTKTPTIILLGSNVINLLLDVVLVAQLKMGPQGAGIATTVAEWIAALCFLGVLAGKLPSADGKNIGSNTKPSESGNIVPVFELPKWMDIRPLVVASSAVFLRSIVLQVAMSSAAAMAARSSAESDIIAAGASSSVAAHQIALQLWLLCSFLCDALATASQILVADGMGREDAESVRTVSQTVFSWGLALGLSLSAILWVGTESNFLTDFFTADEGTRLELTKLLTIVTLAQPLNSFVFAADGVLQGAEEFPYQAKSMALSVLTAFAVFAALEYTPLLGASDGDTLVHVWLGLIALQSMRALTSFVKLIEKQGPIDLLGLGKQAS
ncbi:multidrug and toxic compound extrusion (MATE) family protein, partial [Skeletonema marinoi]